VSWGSQTDSDQAARLLAVPAVWKISGLTAKNFGLTGHGIITVGYHSDVVLFDARQRCATPRPMTALADWAAMMAAIDAVNDRASQVLARRAGAAAPTDDRLT
jgi:N-acyl-D-aspartate/D-glutamate deacylase